MNNFILSNQSQIIIYGAATTGMIFYKIFKDKGFKVLGFLDKRAFEIHKYCGLPVWNPEQINNIILPNNTLLIVIAIKNVFEHEDIAEGFIKMHYTNVLFRPKMVLEGGGSDVEKFLNCRYDDIKEGKFESGFSIPQTLSIKPIALEDCSIIKTQQDYVIARVPLGYIYIDKYENMDMPWSDICCLGLLPHIGLFRTFNGQYDQNKDLYLEFCKDAAKRSGDIKLSLAWENSVLDNRLDVYEHMEQAWEIDQNFFVTNAVEAVWNSGGYFNSMSGKHRLIFQVIKGRQYIPLKIKKEDYYCWLNETGIVSIQNLIKESAIRSLSVPILHPYFYKFPCKSFSFYTGLLGSSIYSIYNDYFSRYHNLNFKNKVIVLLGVEIGCFAAFFEKMGFNVRVIKGKQNDSILSELVSNLLHGQNIIFSSLEDGITNCDYIICDEAIGYVPDQIDVKEASLMIKKEKTDKYRMIYCGFVEYGMRYLYLNSKGG